MKTIILDSGPIISLALNNLLWLFKAVKEKHAINFCITEAVKKEIIDNPFTTKRFKFEALQTLQLLNTGVLNLIKDSEIEPLTNELLELANSAYQAKGRDIPLAHAGELSAVSACLIHGADAVMIDERTTRCLLESPDKLKGIFTHKLHTKVDMKPAIIEKLRIRTRKVKLIRSAEFATIAFEKGLLDDFLPKIKKREQLEAMLWGLKLSGCSISVKDIGTILKIESK